jgi:hypothetical protein
MQLNLSGAQEPRSLLAKDHRQLGEQDVLLMPSAASRELERELRRYCAGEIEGRSFLVAGHRGSGKTTMVDAALLRLRRACEQGEVPRLAVPAYLHAPALLDGSRPGSMALRGAALSESVLKLALLALHRAVAGEFVRAYRHHVLAVADAARVAPGRAELAAQLEIEMTEAPGPARLREFWALAGALDSGVLFTRDIGERNGCPKDQGLRELVALTGIGHVYQRLAGELRETDLQHHGLETQRDSQTGFDSAKVELVRSALPLLAGTAVGTGAAVHGGPAGAAVGAAAFAFAVLGMRWTSTRSEKRSRRIDRTFVPDLSVQTLDRVVPALLERLRAAGIAPVFVIDELDKVDGLWDLMEPLIRDFKKVFAELALTCLIVDRAYHEQLLRSEREQPLGRSFSYYMHRLFVDYAPADVDAYLRRRLRVPAGAAVADGADAAEILRWALRHRGEFNALKLQRELAALPTNEGGVAIDAAELRSDRRWRAEVTFQLAIELQFANEQVAEWIEGGPLRRQAVVDALYYLPRCRAGEHRARTPAAGQQREVLDRGDFAAYLARRVDLQPVLGDEGGTRRAGARRCLSDDEIDFLYGRVEAMAAMLGWSAAGAPGGDGEEAGNPFERAWRDLLAKDAERVSAAALVEPSQALLDAALWGAESLLESGAQGERLWRDDDRANSRRKPREFDPLVTIADYGKEWRAAVQASGHPFDALVACGLLPTMPAWHAVERAIDRIEGAARSAPQNPTPALRRDLALVESFALMLGRHARLVRKALLGAVAIGVVGDPEQGSGANAAAAPAGWQAQLRSGIHRLSKCMSKFMNDGSGSPARKGRAPAVDDCLRECLHKLDKATSQRVLSLLDDRMWPEGLRDRRPNPEQLEHQLQQVVAALQRPPAHDGGPQRQNGGA